MLMDTAMLMKGFMLGFSIAAPVGPIGILCIRRTLAKGMLNGVAAGLGAATADAFYGSAAAFGLTIITNLLLENSLYLHIVGSIFLFYLGYTTFMARPAEQQENTDDKGWLKAYCSTFFLTITNPLTILSFAAIFAGFGMTNMKESHLSAGLLVSGVFLGSAMWWLILSGGVCLLRNTFAYKRLIWINRLSGILICGFGIVSLLGLLV
jgi:threonine/homoserine/homoserine lactone efflux protein